MTILGIGVDVVHLPRILALLNRRRADRFASRILSTTEYGQWKALQISDAQDCVQFLAVRWSVKEASYKAMYPLVKATWKEFTYEKLSGKPSLRYHPTLDMDRHKIGRIHVSVSHDGDYVYSSVLIEEPLP
ncbi:4'-phosphopantetheinyl transferase [Phlegmacium glaucopus]|nr:4'-phosphopantetheinyl transferase [Phlegmacium glaucopus]